MWTQKQIYEIRGCVSQNLRSNVILTLDSRLNMKLSFLKISYYYYYCYKYLINVDVHNQHLINWI